MSVHIENQEYFDWAKPDSPSREDDRSGRFGSLDIFVDPENDRLSFCLRKRAGLKTDFNFELDDGDARLLLEMLKEHFSE